MRFVYSPVLLPSCEFSETNKTRMEMEMETESKEPEVEIQSLSILCKDRADLVFAIPLTVNSKERLFTLKEGSPYHVKFAFVVSNNIVSGLKYIHTVWKTGVKGTYHLPNSIPSLFSLLPSPKQANTTTTTTTHSYSWIEWQLTIQK